MTLFGTTGGSYMTGKQAGKQVFPVDCGNDAESVSQRLVEAAHTDELRSASELISNPYVDVNFMGTVMLKVRRTEVVVRDEDPYRVRVELEDFKTEATALFLAAHNGNLALVRKLLSAGANVNQKSFRGYATTAAASGGHAEVLKMLIGGGAAQDACEEALLEACYNGGAKPAELLMASEMVRPHVAVHALVTASFRGFKDFVDTLIKSGVDCNASARVLLQSSKPFLHANVDCNSLAAAILGRQISVVLHLLQVGARTDIMVRLGAWSWDPVTGEEFRVGAGLADPYHMSWCAVEYYESSGAILRMLLQHVSPNIPHFGRTLMHHAILCGNAPAVEVLLSYGFCTEAPIKTTKKTLIRPIHMASRAGLTGAVASLIGSGCDPNSITESGETALMISVRNKRAECVKLLAAAGADFGLCNTSGQSAMSIAGSVSWSLGFQQAVLDVVRDGKKIVRSSDPKIFSSLLFATQANDIDALKNLLKQPEIDLNEQNENGDSAAMIAAAGGHVEAFKLLLHAGADMKLQNNFGETAVSISEKHENCDAFERVMLNYLHSKGDQSYHGNSILHRAAHNGDVKLARVLIGEGHGINLTDSDGYTPLMLAARRGDKNMCELLVSCGAKCELMTAKMETALSLVRKNKNGRDAEGVILDQLAKQLVLQGAIVMKYTKAGKGRTHYKTLKMVGTNGVLRWGNSKKRNVICRAAEVGGSQPFRWNRRKKQDSDNPGVFRVVTTKNKEVHFVCEGGMEMAELWVRGIKMVTKEAIFGKNTAETSS